MSRPRLVFGSRVQVGDGHLHGLDLLVLGGDGADLVAHLVALHRHVLALDAATETETRIRLWNVGPPLTQRSSYGSRFTLELTPVQWAQSHLEKLMEQ